MGAYRLFPSPPAPPGMVLTRTVSEVTKSRTKISVLALTSLATRFVASEKNATYRPSGVRDGTALARFPWTPAEDRLTKRDWFSTRSHTKTSASLFESPATTSAANELKAIKRPSAEIDGKLLGPAAPERLKLILTSVMVSSARSRTKTSLLPFVSGANHSVDADSKAT